MLCSREKSVVLVFLPSVVSGRRSVQGLIVSPSEPCLLPIPEFSLQASVEPMLVKSLLQRGHMSGFLYIKQISVESLLMHELFLGH